MPPRISGLPLAQAPARGASGLQAIVGWGKRGDRGRLRWAAGILLAIPVLLFCYLRIAGTVPVLSDGAGNALQAWDMLHGNVLLHGWWVTDVSFFTTELPQYMLVELAAGLRPEVVHICAAVTYTLLVVLAALLARGRATGREGLVRALLAAGIMLAPEPGAPTWVLMSSPDHVGTAVPVLLVFLLLERAEPHWAVPVVLWAVLAWSIIGDPLVAVIGALPVGIVCLLRASAALARKAAAPPLVRYEIALAAAAGLAVPTAAAAVRIIRALGGYSLNRGVSGIAPLSVIPGNSALVVRSVLSIFGADLASAKGGTERAFAVVHLAGVSLVLLSVILVSYRIVRSCIARRAPADAGSAANRSDMVTHALAIAVLLNVAAYFVAFRIANIYSAHEIGPVLSLGAALAGRTFGASLSRARPLRVVLAVLACYVVMLGFAVTRPQTAPANASLAAWLGSHGLHSGIAPYWEASSVTLDAGRNISVGPVVPVPGGRLAPRHWETDMRFFDESRHTANFLVLVPDDPVTQGAALATFGQPASVYHYRQYTILVWGKNLLSDLRPAVSGLPAGAVPVDGGAEITRR